MRRSSIPNPTSVRHRQGWGFQAPLRAPLFMVLLFSLVACTQPHPVEAQSEGVHTSQEHDFRVVTVAEGLEHPWGLAFLPNGDLLVTERPGRLRMVRDGTLLDAPLTGVPQVEPHGQGGLLDISLHPDFASNEYVYLTYSRTAENGVTTALSRGVLEGTNLTGVEELFVARTTSTSGAHFGSRLVWDGDGHLFMSIGDRGIMDEAQDPGNHHGTILRLTAEGDPAPGNPFLGRSDALPEIFAYGIRSPQGMALHPETGELWENEHGPRGGDEINIIRAGRNYGWPVISYGINYDGSVLTELTHAPGMEQPLLHWTPSIAVSGMAFYTGDPFPAWKGNVFNGALAGQHLRRVVFQGNIPVHQETLLGELGVRIRDVRQGPDGFIYLLTDHREGAILRLEPTGE
ncbi:MAG: PQQ-dependent sugar dehydrogenase [Gemmatimonadota bacterium]